MKRCTKCLASFPLSNFHKHRGRKDGLTSVCRRCNYEGARRWTLNNRERVADYLRRYHLEHLDKARHSGRERSKRRYLANRELWRHYVRSRRARMRSGTPPTFAEVDQRITLCGKACVYCGGEYRHLDHVNPISRGGRDEISNLVPACARCNLQKQAQPWVRWYRRQPFHSEQREALIRRLLESPALLGSALDHPQPFQLSLESVATLESPPPSI